MKKRAEIARDVIAGYYGSGDKRIEALKKEGYDPAAVQSDVNTLLCCRENIINNIKAFASKIAADNRYRYVYWTEKYGHECAVCHPHNGENHGWQCIGYGIACWHHGGLPIPCNCGVIDNGTGEKILKAKTDAEALRIAQKELNLKDIQVIRNGGNVIPKGKARPGDIGLLFTGNEFQHFIIIMSGTKVADSTNTGGDHHDDIRADRNFAGRYVSRLKVIIRYTGKGLCPAPKRSVDELAHEVLDGLWGSGDSRKTALTEAGHDYDAVQKRVNEILDPPKKPYSGEMPKMALVKTNAEVKADTIMFAKWIAGDNSFHYGYTNKHGSKDPDKWDPNAHHNGCYFCETNTDKGGRSKKGILDFRKTYCCNPFVGAAFAHGGCVPEALKLCQNGSSWNFGKGSGYDASPLFDNLGKPAKSKLQPCDVLCSDTHVALYIGNGKIAEASSGDDNVRNSSKWNNSIHITELTDARYKKFKRVHRYNGAVNKEMYIRHGEINKRVELLQKYMIWFGYAIMADGIFGDQTFLCLKDMQGKLGVPADGIVGPATLAAMTEYRR